MAARSGGIALQHVVPVHTGRAVEQFTLPQLKGKTTILLPPGLQGPSACREKEEVQVTQRCDGGHIPGDIQVET